MELAQRMAVMEEVFTRQLKASAIADTKVATLIGINTTMLAVMAALITQPRALTFWVIALAAFATGVRTTPRL